MSRGWDNETFKRRIADPATRRRWAAGSPDPREIDTYLAVVPQANQRKLAIVLGMTPELRTAVLRRFQSVVSVDRSQEAHDLFQDWVPEELKPRERCVLADWSQAAAHVTGPADAVFGDGVFSNCPDEAGTERLLTGIRRLVAPGGVLVTRHVCYPEHFTGVFTGVFTSWQALLEQHRLGNIDDEGLGFALRFTAFINELWNPVTGHLDCEAVYGRLAELHRTGALPPALYEASLRYHFAGTNWVPDEQRWQALLTRTGWQTTRHTLTGKNWYAYYPIYRCVAVE